MEEKKQRGGARAGAGRPKNSIRRSQYNMHVSEDEKAYIVSKLQQYRCAATNESFVKLVVKTDALYLRYNGESWEYIAQVGNNIYKAAPIGLIDNDFYVKYLGGVDAVNGWEKLNDEYQHYMIMDVEK